MEITLFFKGILIGFVMAVPVGPIGIMCIRKTLTEGQLRGLIIGLGAATADLLFSCVAAFGFTAISSVITAERVWIRLIGGVLLLFLGSALGGAVSRRSRSLSRSTRSSRCRAAAGSWSRCR